MNRSKNTGFADRLNAAADAKKAQLERAARARSAAESPEAVERRKEREAVRMARSRAMPFSPIRATTAASLTCAARYVARPSSNA